MAGIGFLLANPVADQVSAFRDNVPEIVDDANASLADVQEWLDDNGINVQIAEEGQTALGTLGQNLTEGSGELVTFTQDALRTLVEASLALILIIVISVYMLLYGERIGAAIRTVIPEHAGGRLPDPDPARGVRLRPRPAPVLADHGHQRGAAAVGARVARDLPGRQDVRPLLRRLVRASPS